MNYSPVIEACRWLEQLLMGSLATIIATLAVGLVGFALLAGNVSLRRAMHVAIGCFILFGAVPIARGIMDAARTFGSANQNPGEGQIPAAPQSIPSPSFDPYAGASTPM